jgi:hypothetical protein
MKYKYYLRDTKSPRKLENNFLDFSPSPPLPPPQKNLRNLANYASIFHEGNSKGRG